MTLDQLIDRLQRMATTIPDDGRYLGACAGCGYEHRCNLCGCAVLRTAEKYLARVRKEETR